MKVGTKLRYIGKGFLGFDESDKTMYLENSYEFDFIVAYKGQIMRVRKSEVVEDNTRDGNKFVMFHD